MLEQFRHRIPLSYVMLKKDLHSLTSLFLEAILERSYGDQSNLLQCKTKNALFN